LKVFHLHRRTTGDVVFDIINTIIMIFLIIVTLYPFWNTLVYSLNSPVDSLRGGLYLWPRQFTFSNYSLILSEENVYWASVVSILRALTGSVANVLCTVIIGYALSQKSFVLNKFYSYLFVFSMYFSGGLIPGYFLMRDLHLINNFLVYILPATVSAWNIMVVRSYISELPKGLIESAKIDGASEFRIIFSIIFPLSMPVVACILLFVAVGQWNSWFDTMLYCGNNQSLSTLAYELQKVLQTSQSLSTQSSQAQALIPAAMRNIVTPQSVRATMTIITIVPIMCVYPFLQKYFVNGLTLGGVKE